MPKIALIEPKATDLHIYSRIKLPRLGLLILGALMRDRGWEVDWIFEEIQRIDFKRLREADLVGISTITSTAPRAYLIADWVRKNGVPVLLGGPHVTFLADEALQHADFVIRGEGELALMYLIDAWESDRDFSSVPNLSYVVDGEVRHNALGAVEEDLDRIPFPDLSALLADGKGILGHRTIPVQTSRGCPFDCAFCSVTGMFGKGYRFRSPQNVIEELRQYDHPKNHIFFYDDNFAANPKRMKELLQAMQEEKFSFTWSTQVRADIARHEELVHLMRQTGCSMLYIGLESVNPLSLESMNKRQTLRFRWFEVAIAKYARGLNRMWKKRNKTFISAITLLGAQKQARITIDFQQKIELD
ncbi:MAG: radical SAM protein [Candidatus Aminicenantaceae bacterium]